MRGEPRNKPPYPVHFGLFGKPTVINNVETLANIPWILRMGAPSMPALEQETQRVKNSLRLRPCDLTRGLRNPLWHHPKAIDHPCGGTPTSAPIKAILLGGAAGSFVGPDQLDVPLTFEGTRAIGASLGSGVVMVFDETTDLGDILVRIAAFFRDESCGQCVPCRVGVTRQEELVNRLRLGQPKGSVEQEVSLLGEIAQVMRDASICGLGHTASGPSSPRFGFLAQAPCNGKTQRQVHERFVLLVQTTPKAQPNTDAPGGADKYSCGDLH